MKTSTQFFSQKTLFSLTALTFLTAPIYAEYVVTYFDRGQVKAETNYRDFTRTDKREGIKEGLEKVYYQSGQMAYAVQFVDGKRDGNLTWLDRQGKKLSTCIYDHGKLEGEEKTFYVNGKVKKTVMYKNDKKEGLQKEYFDNGQLALEVKYVHNKKEGVQTEYTPEGKLYSKVTYKNNYREGKQEWYDDKGKVTKTIEYKMDRPTKLMKKVQKKLDHSMYKELQKLNYSPNRPHD